MKTLISYFLFILTVSAEAQPASNIDADGIALSGYDPVSYFTGKPLKGKSDIVAKVDNRTYRFSSVSNRDQFLKNPSQYEPAYNGWCAYAVGKNAELVEIDPLTYKIVNGKLLLFFNKWYSNTLPLWNKDEKNLSASAEANWKKLNESTKQ